MLQRLIQPYLYDNTKSSKDPKILQTVFFLLRINEGQQYLNCQRWIENILLILFSKDYYYLCILSYDWTIQRLPLNFNVEFDEFIIKIDFGVRALLFTSEMVWVFFILGKNKLSFFRHFALN